MDEAGGIRLPAGAVAAEEAPSPASPTSAEAVLIGVEAGGRIGACAWDCSWLSGWWSDAVLFGARGETEKQNGKAVCLLYG